MILRVLFSGEYTFAQKMALIIPQILAVLVVIFLVLPIHEWAHGFVAYKMGDRTAKNQGRLTFNPLASIDPIGALCILFFGFGWAKPVPVNPYNFRKYRLGMVLTSLAGPVSNLVCGLIGALVYMLVLGATGGGLVLLGGNLYATGNYLPDFVDTGLLYFVSINVSIAVFNLLPIPPLDGSKVIGVFLPRRIMEQYYRYQRIIFPILIVLLFAGFLSTPLNYAQDACTNFILWLAWLPFHAFGWV